MFSCHAAAHAHIHIQIHIYTYGKYAVVCIIVVYRQPQSLSKSIKQPNDVHSSEYPVIIFTLENWNTDNGDVVDFC